MMFIELATLPVEMQQQILQIQQDNATQNQIQSLPKTSLYDALMAFDYPDDLADIDFDNVLEIPSNRVVELD